MSDTSRICQQTAELPHLDPVRVLVTEFVANSELATRLQSLALELGTRVLRMDVARTGYWLHISRPVGTAPKAAKEENA